MHFLTTETDNLSLGNLAGDLPKAEKLKFDDCFKRCKDQVTNGFNSIPGFNQLSITPSQCLPTIKQIAMDSMAHVYR